jgi:protein-tyrosine phosphatase
MIDIHSHILPGLDDGARSFEQAVEMVQLAAVNGTTDLVATPHSDLRYSYRPEEIDGRLVELREAVGNVIQLYRGCDFHLHYENLQDALSNPTKYTINGKRYLLVEFDDRIILQNTAELLERLQIVGIIPIITHPERNPLLRKRLDDLADWVASGALIQVTAQSFLGRFGQAARQATEELMSRRLVHFVASDAHDLKHRSPSLQASFQFVRRHYGSARAEALFVENPRATLKGTELPAEVLSTQKPARRWLSFYR